MDSDDDQILAKRTKVHHDPDEPIDIETAVCNVGSCNFNLMVPCTKLGNKLSTNLVRIAATRIFADPYQSILELPVNSVDSYMRMNKKPTSIGKFGMGFFSILYWLYHSPNSYLTIDTNYKVNTETHGYNTIIKITPEKLLKFKVQMKRPSTLSTGTTLTLHTSFTQEDVQKFEEQCTKLFLLSDAAIFVNNKFINEGNMSPTSYKFKVHVTINSEGIKVVDEAEGIPYSVLTKSLLVPSSSTKTLNQVSTAVTHNNYELDRTNIIDATKKNKCTLYLTVNNVVVYTSSIHSTLGKDYILNLPSTTRLPVSRDDVILTKQSTTILLEKLLQMMLLSAQQMHTIKDLMTLFEMYVTYTNQSILNQMYDELKLNLPMMLKDYVLVSIHSDESKYVLDAITKLTGISFVDALHIDPMKLENKLLAIVNKLKEVNPKLVQPASSRMIVYLPTSEPIVTTMNTVLLLFVSNSLKDQYDTIIGMLSDTLLFNSSKELYTLNNTLEDINKTFVLQPELYSKSVSASITNLILKLMKLNSSSLLPNIYDSLKLFVCIKGDHQKIIHLFTKIVDTLYQVMNTLNITIAYGSRLWIGFTNIDMESVYGRYKPLDDQGNIIQNVKFLLTYYYPCLVSAEGMCEPLIPIPPVYIDYIEQLVVWSINNISSENGTVYLPECFNSIFGNAAFVFVNFASPMQTAIHVECMNVIMQLTSDLAERTILVFVLQELMYIHHVFDSQQIQSQLTQALKFSRFKFTSVSLYDQLRLIQNFGGLYSPMTFINNFILPVMMNVNTYAEVSQLKLSDVSHLLPFATKPPTFTLKQLITYVYKYELTVNEINSYEFIKEVGNVDAECPDAQLQVVDIAINEGTTKNFIQSVLTELLQNSMDAIKAAKSTSRASELDLNRIDISIKGNVVRMKDNIGIPPIGILSLLLPFLSTKSASNETVGEMGSGFFNVYRQPYISIVTINTCYNNTSVYIVATPIVDKLNPLRVLDAKYEVQVQPNFCKQNGSIISMYLRAENMIQLSDTIVDAYIFVNNYLPYVDGYDIRLNSADVNISKPKKQLYEDDNLTAYYVAFDDYCPSVVFTNNIPLMNFEQFYSTKEDDIKVKNLILNIKPGKYQPVHSRSKVHTTSSLMKSVQTVVFKFALKVYILEPSQRDAIIPNSSSAATIDQLLFFGMKYMNVERMEEPTTLHQLKIILDVCMWLILNKILPEAKLRHTDESKLNFSIKYRLGKVLNEQMLSPEVVEVVEQWFQNKKFGGTVFDDSRVEAPDVVMKPHVWKKAQKFVDMYWKLGKKAYGMQTIKFNNPEDKLNIKLFDHDEAPKVIIRYDMPAAILGSYNKNTHLITLNGLKYDIKMIDEQIDKSVKVDMSLLFTYSESNGMFSNDVCQPGVLIHELLHAVTRTDEFEDSYGHHASMNMTIGLYTSKTTYTFDQVAAYIFKLLCSMGLMKSLEDGL